MMGTTPGVASLRNIMYFPALDLVYVNNPKAGCSSLKKALWLASDEERGLSTFDGDPHRASDVPFVRGWDAVAATDASTRCFSVVRNPYRRLVSAYLDKIAPDRSPEAEHFRTAYRWTDRRAPTLVEALERMADDDLRSIDQHFRPQTLNLMLGLVDFSFVGHLEAFDEVFDELRQIHTSIRAQRHDPHSTRAHGNFDAVLDNRAIELIQEHWRDDFVHFGYSDDPAVRGPLSEQSWEPSKPGLREMHAATPGHLSDDLANFALSLVVWRNVDPPRPLLRKVRSASNPDRIALRQARLRNEGAGAIVAEGQATIGLGVTNK